MDAPLKVRTIDSHTEGEPTRVVLEGLGDRTIDEHLAGWVASAGDSAHGAHGAVPPPPAWLLSLVAEPRAAPATVAAILCRPRDPANAAGVIFLNSVGPLGMCGHGTIGLVRTLRELGRVGDGECRIETPVGLVTARCRPDGRIEVDNVPSRRFRGAVEVIVDGQPIRGDIAWGGNWFFMIEADMDLDVARLEQQLLFTEEIRDTLERNGVRGAGGAPIDHVAVFGNPIGEGADSRNFVLCPNGSYDRSPCGTGTSAKLACLAADGRLAPGEVWTQESVIGSRFEAWYRPGPDGHVLPTIAGRAWITARTELVVDPRDPATAAGWSENP
jgi:4-hydroxyproline epimerase